MQARLTLRQAALADRHRRGSHHRRRPRVPAWLGLSALQAVPAAALSLLSGHSAGARGRRPAAANGRGRGSILLVLIFVASAALGAYHAGVEWGLWLGPSDCGGNVGAGARQGRRSHEPAQHHPGRELHGGGMAVSRPVARRLERADLAGARGRRLGGGAARRGWPTAPARCPSRGSRASCRAGSSAETAGRWNADPAGSARRGFWRGHISTWLGRRSPFRRLQGAQAATTLSQVVWPPLERGMTWSKVRSSRVPQYWQVNRSRRKTLKRVKAGCRDGLT